MSSLSQVSTVCSNIDLKASRQWVDHPDDWQPFEKEHLAQLNKITHIPDDVKVCLEACGLSKPHKIVNTFGLGVKMTALAIAQMKPSFIIEGGLNQEAILRLIIYARQELDVELDIEALPKQEKHKKKKTRGYDNYFMSYDDETLQALHDDVADRDNHAEAQELLPIMRKQIRHWLKVDDVPSVIGFTSQGSSLIKHQQQSSNDSLHDNDDQTPPTSEQATNMPSDSQVPSPELAAFVQQ